MTLYYAKPILDEITTHTRFREAIRSGLPFMSTRIGGVEFSGLLHYLKIRHRRWWRYFPIGIRNQMRLNAGVISADSRVLWALCERYLTDLKLADLIGVWEKPEEPAFFAQECPQAELATLRYLDPVSTTLNPSWTYALEGKKVLVIHPFEASIKAQYARRTDIFPTHQILPEFDLLTIKAVQSIAGSPTEFSSWFEALNAMETKIDSLDFDVALIGAGAYGLPLAAHVKRKGKVAMHLGGSLQLLFGIKGARWLQDSPFVRALVNSAWVSPLEAEKPSGFKKIEDGCYW